MRAHAKRCFSVMCAMLMLVMVFQNVTAEDNVVDVDVFMDYNHVQHKVWRTEANGTYQIHYANSLMDNGTDLDRDGDNDTSLEMGWPGSDDDQASLDPNIGLNFDGDLYDDNSDDDDDTPCNDVTQGDNVEDVNDAFPHNPTGWRDMDRDGLPDSVLAAPAWFLDRGGIPLTQDPDIDGDGVLNGADKFPSNRYEWADTDFDGIGDNADPDDDGDGALDSMDAFPQNPTGIIDTDKDKLPDVALPAPLWWLGPNLIADPDDDGDRLLDVVETNTKVYVSPTNTGTNPLVVDTDRDKLSDYEEVMGRTIRVEINNLPGADIIYTVNSDPTKKNSDNDLLDDYWEKQYGTDPRHEDTDNDGLMDQDELIDDFGGGWMLPGDTDSDGTPNGPTDWDSNGNAVPDGLENVVSGFPSFGQPGYDGGADYDGDGLSNDFERTTDYNPNIPGIQNTSYLTKDSDKDGFLDGADLDSGAPKSWIITKKLSTGAFTKIDILVHIGLDMGIQRGEGYLAPPSAVGSGEKGTSPLKDNDDGDGVPDGYDVDPLKDLVVTVEIQELLQRDFFIDNLMSPFDSYVIIWCEKAKVSGFNIYTRLPAITPICFNTVNPTNMGLKYTFNVPDLKPETGSPIIKFTISAWDFDVDLITGIRHDDLLDINDKVTGGGTLDNSALHLDYNLDGFWQADSSLGFGKEPWRGDDFIEHTGYSLKDDTGYGHSSGADDGSKGSAYSTDADLWFYLTQNDKDNDGLTYYQESIIWGSDYKVFSNGDFDGDGLTGLQERQMGSNPNLPNSDIDSLTDYQEYLLSTSPVHWSEGVLPYRVVDVGANSMTTEVKAVSTEEVENFRDDDNYIQVLYSNMDAPGKLLYPAIGCPAFVDKSGPLNLQFIVNSATIEEVILSSVESIFDWSTTTINKGEPTQDDLGRTVMICTINLPAEIPAELFDLTVVIDGTEYNAYHSVQVLNFFKSSFKFIQLTDIHIGDGSDENKRVSNFLAIIKRINTIEHPDFIIITGDLTDWGTSDETKYFKACLLRINAPVFLTPGNHDNYWDVGDKFTDYREYLNPPVLSLGEDEEYCDDYSFDYGAFHFIVFNSGESNSVAGFPVPNFETRGLTQTQLDWMEADQNAAVAAGKLHTFIFTHTPSVPDAGTSYRSLGWSHSHRDSTWINVGGLPIEISYVDNDVAFVNWVNANPKIEAVFAGHTHSDYIFYDVHTDMSVPGNINNPFRYDYPKLLNTLHFSNPAFYLETSSTGGK